MRNEGKIFLDITSTSILKLNEQTNSFAASTPKKETVKLYVPPQRRRIENLQNNSFTNNEFSVSQNRYSNGCTKTEVKERNYGYKENKCEEEEINLYKREETNNEYKENIWYKGQIKHCKKQKVHQDILENSYKNLSTNIISEEDDIQYLFDNFYQSLTLSMKLSCQLILINSNFDVHIAVADNPGHFVIQNLKSKNSEFSEMTRALTAICRNYKGSKLTYQSIQAGQLYASNCKMNRHTWFRVFVTKIVDSKFATIYYCDYGCTRTVLIENLLPLPLQFVQLPAQAIWAKLHGIKPLGTYWTVNDNLRFKDLVFAKNFVCTVKNITDTKYNIYEKGFARTIETICSVELTDKVKDVNIANILVNEGRALKH